MGFRLFFSFTLTVALLILVQVQVTKGIKTLEKDKCGDLKSVGKPITHNTQQYIWGSWMKDPLGEMGSEAIFVMNNYHSNNILVEYQTMEKFKAGVPFKKYKLPYAWDGTGAVVYGPYLYYNRANSHFIVKYNLLNGLVEAQISLNYYYTVRKNYYQWTGYSGVDLAVDEHGLWVISGTTGNGYRPYVSKIDVVSNKITHAWSLSGVESMKSMGNAFMACGVFYAVDSYSSRTTTINYAYDTKTRRSWNPSIFFVNQYGYNSMIAYNPREKVLYSWDSSRQVTYSLTFKS